MNCFLPLYDLLLGIYFVGNVLFKCTNKFSIISSYNIGNYVGITFRHTFFNTEDYFTDLNWKVLYLLLKSGKERI